MLKIRFTNLSYICCNSYKNCMRIHRLILLVALTIGFVTTSFSQHQRYRIQNGIGIYGGITQFDFSTKNFTTKAEQGWLVGASATVDIPHKWYNMSYSIQLAENKIGIVARPNATVLSEEFLDYKLFTAQIALLMHVKLIGPYVTLDVGPMLQYNGDLELKDDNKENYIINSYANLMAKDISEISKFNVDGAVGISAGISHFRLKAQYIYGFLNSFNKLNDANLDRTGNPNSFKGNQSMLVFTAMVSF